MADNLSTIMQTVFSRLGQSYVDLATGGSTTSLIDTKLTDQFADDDFEQPGGGVFVVRSTDNEAPEGEFSSITSFSQDSATFTVGTLTAAIGAGDVYMVTSTTFPLRQVAEAVNSGLKRLGDLVDTYTSLVTLENTTRYTLPLTLKRSRPVKIQIQWGDGDEYTDFGDYDIVPAAPGSTGELVIPILPSGKTMRIWYEKDHPVLTVYNSPLSETIKSELAVTAAIVEVLDWYNSRNSGTDTYWLTRQAKAEQDFINAKVEFKPWRPTRRAKGFPHWDV